MNLIDLISKHPVPVTRFQRPYVIAEAGVNHEGSMDIARRLIDEAALGGADAIKFQTYKAGTLASKHSPAYWDTSKEPTPSQYELFKKHDSFWKGEFENLKKADDKAYPFLIGVSRLQHGGKRGKPGSPNHRALMPVYAI